MPHAHNALGSSPGPVMVEAVRVRAREMGWAGWGRVGERGGVGSDEVGGEVTDRDLVEVGEGKVECVCSVLVEVCVMGLVRELRLDWAPP